MTIMKNILKAILITIVGIVVGYLLLVFAYLLPTKPMKANISQSVNVFDTEKEYHRVIPGYISTQLDNYTDSWMVGNAIFDNTSESIWKRVLTCTRAEYGEGPLDSLIRYASGETGYSTEDYARYWHGYLIVLKPLFLLFDYADFRVINIIFEVILVLAVFMAFRKNGFVGESYAYIVAVLFIMPIVIPLSIQFSVIFYIANIASIIMLKGYDVFKYYEKIFIFFQIVGMATSYFDFLTYPIATLGLPIVCMLLMNGELYDGCDLISEIKNIILCAISWGFGYVSMWFGKWALSSVVLGDNVILDAFNQITMRSAHETEGEKIDIISTWLRNVEFYFEKPYMAIIILSVIVAIVILIIYRKGITNIVINAIPYIVTALMPFAWYAVATQHSYEHHWFTFRGTIVSVFALLCMVITSKRYGDNG
jgi:hypothetical protein